MKLNNRAVLAIDVGGSKLLCGFVARDGRVIGTAYRALKPDTDVATLEAEILACAAELRENHPDNEIAGAGMNIPGLADPKKGLWQYACFSGIRDYPVAERLSPALGMALFIENDVNACARAERIYGCCRDASDFLWVTVSNGIGGGLVLGGEIYQGAFGGAGEFGHIVVDPDGLICPCGHKGCMEAMAAGPAIRKRYALAAGISPEDAPDAKEIAQRARAGEKLAAEIYRQTGEYLGRALGICASLLNLQRYVLGGGVMQSWDLLRDPIREAFGKTAFCEPNRAADIRLTALGYNAALFGAAATAWNGLKEVAI